MFLLGSFGVQVLGQETKIVPRPKEIGWGDLTLQGFPFYSGNVQFKLPIKDLKFGRHVKLVIRHFEGPVIRVDIDGKRKGLIAFNPFELDLGNIDNSLELQLTLYGNRYNSFGHLHFDNFVLNWCSPQAWRGTGNDWTYMYLLSKFGITSIPELVATS
jgi:hypothetical protein